MSGLELLIVDDYESMRVILSALLRAFGFSRIREAGHGEAALEMLAQFPADIVITDLKMPVRDGLSLTRMIRREDGPISETPIILVTGHSNPSRIIAARDAGVNEIIVKPVVAAVLADRLRRVINQPREFVQVQTYRGPCRRRRIAKDYTGPFRRAADHHAGRDALRISPRIVRPPWAS